MTAAETDNNAWEQHLMAFGWCGVSLCTLQLWHFCAILFRIFIVRVAAVLHFHEFRINISTELFFGHFVGFQQLTNRYELPL